MDRLDFLSSLICECDVFNFVYSAYLAILAKSQNYGFGESGGELMGEGGISSVCLMLTPKRLKKIDKRAWKCFRHDLKKAFKLLKRRCITATVSSAPPLTFTAQAVSATAALVPSDGGAVAETS